jgi:hypothetical protein
MPWQPGLFLQEEHHIYHKNAHLLGFGGRMKDISSFSPIS